MSLLARESPIIALTPAANYAAFNGYLVIFSGEVAELLSDPTIPANGVILDGGSARVDYADYPISVAVLGPPFGTVRMKASGTITKGDRVQQGADGTVVTDAGSGVRVLVGVALDNAVAGDLFECALHQALPLT